MDRGFDRWFDQGPDWRPGRWVHQLPARVALLVAALVGLAGGWGLRVRLTCLLPVWAGVLLFLLALAGATVLALQGAPQPWAANHRRRCTRDRIGRPPAELTE
ncbi:MAG: hypothetical protein EA400_18510 [Chromatiaceae bacterium]|nr:MAG: hypothetical protein EA400_18510 [Chromatiaceae bacterium]